MCKAPKPPPIKEPDKPEFLHNRYLDAALGGSGIVDQLRTGRSSLRIRQGSTSSTTDRIGGLLSGERHPGEELDQPGETGARTITPQTSQLTDRTGAFHGVRTRIASLRLKG